LETTTSLSSSERSENEADSEKFASNLGITQVSGEYDANKQATYEASKTIYIELLTKSIDCYSINLENPFLLNDVKFQVNNTTAATTKKRIYKLNIHFD
jgi:hypothetical protein